MTTWGQVAGLASFAAHQWTLEDEPSVTGDVARIDFLSMPSEPGYTPGYFEILKDDGAEPVIERIPMGPALSDVRRIRVSAGRATTVYARVIWVETATGFEMASVWSNARTVTPTVGAPVLVLSRSRAVGVAPAGIQFQAELRGSGELRPYHDVRYRWI